MKNIILCELDRMYKSKKNRWLFIVSTVVFILFAFFIRTFDLGFYDPNTTVYLDSLNTAPFIMREFHLYLVFVFCPMIFIESFNHEFTVGAYRMILGRGYNKKEYIIAKLVSCALITGLFMLIMYIIGNSFGFVFMNRVESTHYFNIDRNFGILGAIIYNLKYYALEYLIMVAIMAISSIVGIISKNSIVAYILSLGLCIGAMYINDLFVFFFLSSQTIFDVLSNMNNNFMIICTIIILLSSGASVFVFDKKDYLD